MNPLGTKLSDTVSGTETCAPPDDPELLPDELPDELLELELPDDEDPELVVLPEEPPLPEELPEDPPDPGLGSVELAAQARSTLKKGVPTVTKTLLAMARLRDALVTQSRTEMSEPAAFDRDPRQAPVARRAPVPTWVQGPFHEA
jgi:hypothetical protein